MVTNRVGAERNASLRVLLAVVCALVSLGLILAAGATAKTYSFNPVAKTKRAVIFKPHGVDSARVKKGVVHARYSGHKVVRRVPVRKIRRAVERGTRVRFGKPGSGHHGKRLKKSRLRVSVKRGGRKPPTTEPTPTDPPPTDPPPTDPPPTDPPPTEPPPTGPGGCGSTLTLSVDTMPSCWRPYADSSPFNRKLPSNPSLVSNSSSMVSWWASQSDTNKFKWAGGYADTRNDYDHPIYFNKPSDPLFTIHCKMWTSSCKIDGMQVRIPQRAKPAGGSDGHMTVIDQATGWEWNFWQTGTLPSGGGDLFISHGGRTKIDGDGLDSNGTAAHFGGTAGIIRPEELAAGKIPHALFLVVNCTNGKHVYPAGDGVGRTCSSMGLSGANAPAMGQQFFLDMSDAQIDGLNAPAWKKTVLTAMANYGLIVGDTGGGSLKTLSGTSYTSFGLDDPWTVMGNRLGLPSWSENGKRMYSFDLRDTVDWQSRLRVVDPCVTAGTC